MRHKLLIVAALFCATACAPKLGDDCDDSFECSANGTRFCDKSQPGGYCTIKDCEPKSCSGEGLCVRFKPDEPRLSTDWCMAKCDDTGDCGRNGYVCRGEAQLNPTQAGALRRVEVLDDEKNGKFCVVRE